MVNISLHVVDIRYRNKCSHSKSPLQVSFLELMAQGASVKKEKGHICPEGGDRWQPFWGAPIWGICLASLNQMGKSEVQIGVPKKVATYM